MMKKLRGRFSRCCTDACMREGGRATIYCLPLVMKCLFVCLAQCTRQHSQSKNILLN